MKEAGGVLFLQKKQERKRMGWGSQSMETPDLRTMRVFDTEAVQRGKHKKLLLQAGYFIFSSATNWFMILGNSRRLSFF